MSNSFLSKLGMDFLELLYNDLCKAEVCFVYKDNSKVYGFVVGSTNPKIAYKRFYGKQISEVLPKNSLKFMRIF